MGKPTQVTAAELSMLEKPRTGDDAKDITPNAPRRVIIEQDPLYPSYVAWGRAMTRRKEG